MAGIDVNRTTAGVSLPPAVSAEIWGAVGETSAATQLATQVDLPGSGVAVDIITGDPVAEWVQETEEKPVSRPTLGTKLMRPYTLAVIVPFSNQFRRDKARLYNALINKLPSSLSLAIDQTVFGPAGGAPGDDFDTLGDAAAVGIAGSTYGGLVAADQAVAAGGGLLNGWALSPQARGLLLGAVDGQGRPLFINNIQTDGAVPALLGSPVYQTRGVYREGTPAQLGFAGDWTSAHWGSVEGVQISFADQATLTDGSTQINLWQRNMFAVRAEIEFGFRVRDIAHFAKLTTTEQPTPTPPEGD